MNKEWENIITEINNYVPFLAQEQKDKDLFLSLLDQEKEKLFLRESLPYHFSASAFILNEKKDKVLFCYHLIYQSWSWLGGHADGNFNLFEVAKKEVQEECGLKNFRLLSPSFSSLECLSVKNHYKRNVFVPDHFHLNVSYVFLASEKEKIYPRKEENSAVKWIKIQDLKKVVTEEKMLPIYEK